MLPRAALRAIRPLSTPSSSPLRYASPIIPTTTLRTRHASSSNRPPRPPPPKVAPKAGRKAGAPTPPSPHPQQPASGQARQTSPGTQFPKGQTWKPKDGIRLGGPAAGTVSGAGVAAAQRLRSEDKAAYTPVDGKRPEEPEVTVRRERALEEDVRPQEPLAQKYDIDEPRRGGQRDTAQKAQAAAENTPPPPEHPAESEVDAQPKGPLPDLRQGIPSTFDMEFGRGKQRQEGREQDGLDIAEGEPEAEQRGEREEREYDRSAYETSLDRRRARMANYLYAAIAAAAAASGVYFSRPFGSREEVPQGLSEQDATSWSPMSMYARVRARMGSQVGYYTEPTFTKLLPEMAEGQRMPYTLVLSLEDLMIHTTWDREHGYRTAKRPGIDYFIRYLQQYYELVLFTSVPIGVADPVMRKLDPYHIIQWPLGREATKYDGGDYVKDLAYLNRPLNKTLIIDTNARHVKNQPENSIILPKWIGDPKDPHTKDLVALIPFLEYVATTGTGDVRDVLKSFEGKNIPEEFARREAIARQKFNDQLAVERGKAPRRSLGSLGSALGIKSTPGMGGGMVLADGQSVAEGLKEGKMLSDQIREQGQKQYEWLETQIREHGAEWLAEEKEAERKMMEGQVQDMKKGAVSWFGFGGGSGGGGGK